MHSVTASRILIFLDISLWSLQPSSVDFLVHEEKKLKVHRYLSSQRLNHTVLIMDVQRRIDAQGAVPLMWTDTSLRSGHRLNWNSYPTLQIIEEYLDFLTENYPSICKVYHIGNSVENRTIKMIKVSNGNPNNKIMLLTAGLHAREWVAITSVLYILNNIVTKFDHHSSYMKNKDWHVIPLLNPDGFEYTHNRDRLWRKNRRRGKSCEGVDLNRNFAIDWYIKTYSETNECKECYGGPSPFSEPEAVAFRDYIKISDKKPTAFIDFHGYGQLILYPWSARSSSTPHEEIHKNIAKEMQKIIYNTTKQVYKIGTIYQKTYPSTGVAVDWVYLLGVNYSFVIESRNTGIHGFLLPSEEIEDTGKELFAATRVLAKLVDPEIMNRGRNVHTWF